MRKRTKIDITHVIHLLFKNCPTVYSQALGYYNEFDFDYDESNVFYFTFGKVHLAGSRVASDMFVIDKNLLTFEVQDFLSSHDPQAKIKIVFRRPWTPSFFMVFFNPEAAMMFKLRFY